jgi:hypothetical protein
MNLDYIDIAKFLGKDKPSFDYLQRNAVYPSSNIESFYFERCKKIEVMLNNNTNHIRIRGSIPYFINGHNYYSSQEDWLEGLDYLSSGLNINLFAALVNCFEFGTIQDIPFKEADFLRNHIKMKGMETREYRKQNILTGKEFENQSLKIKLYDVSRNIKYKLDKAIREDLSSFYGWDKAKHYIKLENHYKKPEVYFKQNLYVSELISTGFQDQLKNELIKTYQGIMKTGNINFPPRKADINAGTIPLMILKELEGIYNFNTEELIKQKLKAIEEKEIFSHADRKARQRTIKDNLKKIGLIGKSEYDISELLEAKLQDQPIYQLAN